MFVDGLHTYDQAYRDVVNALDVLREDGVVVVHDCNPASAAAAAPSLDQARRTDGFNWEWNGDVYKAIVRLRVRDDLRVGVLDCDQGVGIVTRGSPEARIELSLDQIGRLEFVGSRGPCPAPRAAAGRASAAARRAARLTHHPGASERGLQSPPCHGSR